MQEFPNVTAYYQRLKSLVDQLRSVDTPVTSSRLILQLVDGLTEAYKNDCTHIRQSKPLPSFSEACYNLRLKEKALDEMNEEAPAAMVARDFDEVGGKNNNKNFGLGGGKKHGVGRNSSSGGGNRRAGGGRSSSETQQVPVQKWQPTSPWMLWGWMPHWALPCPYPTQQLARPPSGPTRALAQQGILGSRPQQQAYAAAGPPTQ
ncbi:uncharacterized protein [Spinacia oleracea]|uniref:Uncharacterized protein n=1 Tax=Spinacia oleracea TaxID=3562 RepID=A0A9R0IBM7_SPIOL|nr:uncharacterized protein LOC110786012 [Spinacia oleracea]